MNTGRPPLAIFDLDGTLANIEHRLHYIARKPKRWDRFFRACGDDAPNKPVIELAQTLRAAGWEIWIWSGRSDVVRAETERWLATHLGPTLPLRMRRDGDHQADVTLKESWLLDLSPHDRSRLRFIVDDRASVVAMWRSHGVTCLQCAEGQF
ncbi:MAG: hypothetical protein JJT88_04670 [Gammaproteobacteria bacterium]|nr:hypothetical protein [Gammaproteobacteria bacterium]